MLNPNNPYSQYAQNNPYYPNNQYYPNSPYPQYNRQRRSSCLGCFLVVLGLVGIGFGLVFVLATVQSQPPAIFYQGDLPLSNIGVFVAVGVVVLLLLLLSLVARVIGGKPLSDRVKGLSVLLLIVAFGIGLLWHVFVNPNIGLTHTGFLRTAAVDINDGDAIHFRNPANGVTQILCVGVDQHCQPRNGDPPQLDRGLVIQPGQTVSVVFNTDGNYQITSKTTPHMNITISVTTADSGDSV